MESWSAEVKWMEMVLSASLAKTTWELVLEATQRVELAARQTQRERALKASQLAGRHQVSENRPEQAKSEQLELPVPE
jgi:hypothetical protein